MFNHIWTEIGERLQELPREMGTEAVGQIKGTTNQSQHSAGHQPQTGDSQAFDQQQYLQDLYGTSQMTPQQLEVKRQQDNRIIRNRYTQIQEEIKQYRQKKVQEKTKYDIGWQALDATARTREEEYELWELEQKKAAKKKQEREDIILPGSKQGRSGEQSKIMG